MCKYDHYYNQKLNLPFGRCDDFEQICNFKNRNFSLPIWQTTEAAQLKSKRLNYKSISCIRALHHPAAYVGYAIAMIFQTE